MARPHTQEQTAPQGDGAPQAGAPLTLSANDVLGMLQRNAQELIAYCWRDPSTVDPNIVISYLERGWQFAQHLPDIAPPAGAPNGKGRAS